MMKRFSLAFICFCVLATATSISFGQSAIDGHGKAGDPYKKGDTIEVNAIVGQIDFLADGLPDGFAIVEASWSTGNHKRLMNREYVFQDFPLRFGPLKHAITATDADSIKCTVRLIAVEVHDFGGVSYESWELLDSVEVNFTKKKGGGGDIPVEEVENLLVP